MNSYLKFLEEDCGETTVDMGVGFFSYTIDGNTGEMYVGKLFIDHGHRTLENVNKMKKLVISEAKNKGVKYITGTVFLKECNKDRFVKKLALYERLGFKPLYIENNAVVLGEEV